MTEQEYRITALSLLNQAFPDSGAFDARDIAVLAKVLPLIGAVGPSFQSRVQPWMLDCFNAKIAADKLERKDRFLEEALELVQAPDEDEPIAYTAERAHALVEYVFFRPPGEPGQEVGGTMVTLAAMCLARGLDMHAEGERELARINQPEVIEKIRAKQASKPTGSVLPIALGTQDNAS